MAINKFKKNHAIKTIPVKRVIVTVCFIALASTFWSFAPPSVIQSDIDITTLINNPKLNDPEAILRNFVNGKSTTPIIVNLLSSRKSPVPGFKHKHVREQLKKEVKDLQNEVIRDLDPDHVRITNLFTYIFGFSAEVTEAGLRALLDHPKVLSVDEDAILYAHTNQGISLMNASAVRSTYNGSGLAIAICDTGIDYTHAMLGNSSFPNTKVIGGYDCGDDDTNPMDADGHGTCCAGIAAGDLGSTGDYIGGVAYNAKLYAVKISTGSTGSATLANMVEGWEWCVTHQDDDASNPIMIISTSFGGGRFYNQTTCDAYSSAMTTAAANAKAVGITIFVSTGNDGYCDSMGWPACLSDVVSIGAVYDANIGRYPPPGYVGCIALGSCAGYTTGCPCPSGRCYVDNTTAADQVTTYSNSASFMSLFAPSNAAYTTDISGSGGYSSGDYYSGFGGTSAACPYAAGAAACLQQAANAIDGSYLTPDQVEAYLVYYGDLVTDGKVDITKPRVNLGNALGGVTLAFISSFQAYSDSGQAVVHWQTGSEYSTAGFYLLRRDEATRRYHRVNTKFLPGLLHSPQGGVYRFVDQTACPGETYTYKLVEVESRGNRRTHGPFTVTVGLKKEDVSWPGLEPMQGDYSKTPHPLSPAQMARLRARQQELAISRALEKKKRKGQLKISVKEKGLYFLGMQQIADLAGVPVFNVQRMIRNRKLDLISQGEKVAWISDKEKAGIYFYGEGITDSITTDRNVYWLKPGNGLAMGFFNGGKPGQASGNETFKDTIHIEEDHYALTALFDDPECDFWLWDFVKGGEDGKTFDFDAFGVAPSGTATLTIHLKGATNTAARLDHHVKVQLNGTTIGQSRWDGINSHRFDIDLNQSLLVDGRNTIKVSGVLDNGVPYSIFHVDSFDLQYHRYYRAVNDRLLCRGGDNPVITVSGFTSPNIFVFDVTRPREPRFVSNTNLDAANRVSFIPGNPNRLYLAVSINGLCSPVSVIADKPSQLKKKGNSADYVVIAGAGLENAAQNLADLRERRGFESMVVELEDIYDEFNYGISDPQAVRAFLKYAYHNWSRKGPRYVVLAGNGTYDYKNVLGHGDNLIPPLLVNTQEGLFAADNRFGDVKSTGKKGVPEIAIGRLPVLTNAELQALVDKISAYEYAGGTWTDQVIMMADNPDNCGDFPGDSDYLALLVPPGHRVDKIYLDDFPSVDEAREKVIDSFNMGAVLASYIGHAGLTSLAAEGLLRTQDVPALQNGVNLPVLTAFTCVAGRFAIPGYDSLSEVLLLKENGGVAASWAPTGGSINNLARLLAEGFFKALFQGQHETLGKAVLQALHDYAASGCASFMVDIYNLLGDPALEIK